MRWRELIRTALLGVSSNPLRSALTALGVIIGVASVIATLALGNGAKVAVEEQFQSLGSDEIMVSAKMEMREGEVKPVGKILSYEDGLKMAGELPGVDRVDMEVSGTQKVRYGRASDSMAISGTTATGLDALAVKGELQPIGHDSKKPLKPEDFIDRGRFFTPAEVLGNARVCVIGAETARTLFSGDDPIGQTVMVGRQRMVVIGVLKRLEYTDPSKQGFGKPNDTLVIPISTAIRQLYEDEPSVDMTVHVADAKKMDEMRASAVKFLRKRHDLERDATGKWKDDFSITTREQILGAQQEAARMFSLLLAGMAAVALVVGGIGIMNVMLVSVSERTREIGVRLAIGARSRDIVRQFLLEAALIGVVGGVLGTAVGLLAVPAVATLFDRPAALDPRSIPLALFVALATGITFGVYPAVRASKLDPIEALRYE